MPRNKEYIKEQVLDASTKTFWERGFSGTSISNLVEATGLNKHSMYKEFGSKEGLFLACLDNYTKNTTDDINKLLNNPPLGFINIERFFENRINYLTSKEFLGCLLVNTAIEKELLSPEINEKTKKFLYEHEQRFYECLVAAEKNNEIPKGKDLVFYAKYLICFLEGMMVFGKTNPPKNTLEMLVKEVFSKIKE